MYIWGMYYKADTRKRGHSPHTTPNVTLIFHIDPMKQHLSTALGVLHCVRLYDVIVSITFKNTQRRRHANQSAKYA